MEEYSAETYGERIAAIYDELYANYDPAAIHFLAQLAKTGPALEFGIGTGRFALPLQAMGIEVHGIDASPAMVERLHAKPGGERIPVTLGDFTIVQVPAKYPLVYLVFNTIFGLLTQAAQIRCFENAASHLDKDGVFVVEAFVPDLKRYVDGQSLRVTGMDIDTLRLDAATVDFSNQLISAQHIHVSGRGVQLFPVRLRYIWPSEMDLMARIAGMQLRQRWSSWDQAAFTSNSQRHISLYELAE